MPGPDNPQQIPLDLSHGARFSREDFISGRSNQAALAIIERWPGWAASTVILTGPQGCGKSHLAAIWQERAKAVKLEPGQAGLDAFDSGGRNALMEDIGAGMINDTALFHLLNRLSQSGGALLMTSRMLPSVWGVTLPDLASRLRAAAIAEISEPDDALLCAVIAKLFADRQLTVDANVVSFLVARMERSLAAAADIVEKLDRLSLERQTRITRALAAEVVSGDDPRQSELSF
jgi:chromosomal replication initiation ATPase DnaA